MPGPPGCGYSPGLCYHPARTNLNSRSFCRPSYPSSNSSALMVLASAFPELERTQVSLHPGLPQPTSDVSDLLEVPAFQSHHFPAEPPSQGCHGPRHILPVLPGPPGMLVETHPVDLAFRFPFIGLAPALRWSCQRMPSSANVHSQSSHWLALLLRAPKPKTRVQVPPGLAPKESDSLNRSFRSDNQMHEPYGKM